MKTYVFSKGTVKLIYRYRKRRSQNWKLDITESTFRALVTAVPQGST